MRTFVKKTMPIFVASDHAGVELKEFIVRYLQEQGHAIHDYGAHAVESVDYPDYAHQVASAVSSTEHAVGILICGTGNGMSMVANKYGGVRCALCWNVEIALLARQHNNANILAMPARFVSAHEAIEMVACFLATEFEGGRHQARIDKIELVRSN